MKIRLSKMAPLLASGAIFLGAAGTASANMSAQQKFEALTNAGVFQPDSGSNGFDENMTRSQVSQIMSKLFGNEAGDDHSSGQSFSDVASDHWASQYIQAADLFSDFPGDGQGGTGFGRNITMEELAAVLLKALGFNSDTFPQGNPENWAQQYVSAAIEFGFLPETGDYTQTATRQDLVDVTYSHNSNTNEVGLEDDAKGQSGAGSLPGYPDWADFPYTASGALTPESIVNAGAGCSAVCQAVYTGRVEGVSGTGQGMAGSISLDFDFAQGHLMFGEMTFSDGYIFIGGTVGSASQPIAGFVSGGHYAGGVADVSGAPFDLSGSFFGPAAEEAAGQWQFNVIGGSEPGLASGFFAGKR